MISSACSCRVPAHVRASSTSICTCSVSPKGRVHTNILPRPSGKRGRGKSTGSLRRKSNTAPCGGAQRRDIETQADRGEVHTWATGHACMHKPTHIHFFRARTHTQTDIRVRIRIRVQIHIHIHIHICIRIHLHLHLHLHTDTDKDTDTDTDTRTHAHTVGPEIAQSEDAFAICHHDALNVLLCL